MITRRDLITSAAAACGALPGPRTLGAQPGKSRPNILLLFPDQHRFDWTGFNKNLAVRTPNLDRLAQRGMRFTNAVVASPLCAPSRACLASGKEYENCRVRDNTEDYPLDQKTYYTLLRESGYHTAACGKIDLHKASPTWGLDGKHLLPEWGFSDGIDNAGKGDAVTSGASAPKDPYMEMLYKRGLAAAHIADFKRRRKDGYAATFPTPLPEDAYCDNWIAANALELMSRFPRGKPWHLAINFTGPHNPEDITVRMEKLVRGRDFVQPNRCREFTRDQHVAIRQNYTGMVENIDRLVGRLLEELKKRGELENTLVVYSSDHGEMLGDHNRWGKVLPYHASAAVPMVIAGPGVRDGVVSDALVSHMDLAATFLEFASVRKPAEMDSRSMKSLLEGKTRQHREAVRSGLGAWRMAFDGRYKLVRGFDADTSSRDLHHAAGAAKLAGPLLFDLQDDPLENVNIAPKAGRHVERLSKFLSV
ncbi:MAG TPA: sulfatase-like hydrolase/transferase [Bryobacteraceae bacterium]|nr:sulfatase-like hydrolase/transferase [Bryobacteraceae bacterium]